MRDNTAELAAILQRIDAAHDSFMQALAALSGAQTTAPLQDGSTVKDLLAHVAFWDGRFMFAMQPEPPDAFRLAPPEIADIPYREIIQWADAVNARIRQRNQHRPFGDVKHNFERNWERMWAFLQQLTPHDVFDGDGLSAVIGMPFEPFMRGIYDHYEEHAEELRHHRAHSS